jgi:mannose-6-phosphate isomerase-like protein (cupin superfamily)
MTGDGKIRRVVTGHDASGKAIVVSDGLAPSVRTNPLRPGHVSVDIWRTKAAPATIGRDEPDPTAGPRKIHADPGGTVFRISEVAPESDAIRNLTPEKARELFKAMGNENASTWGRGGRHPLMHRTETVDYAVVLDGEIFMVLDDTEVKLTTGDVVIQRGTNHAWSNRSGKPVRMLYVLIDGRFDPELAAQLTEGGKS